MIRYYDYDVVDLFCGAGGNSYGAHLAKVRVVFAANHWPLAVDIHQKNHPDSQHMCQDLHQADWRLVPRHDLLIASPACQGHAKARGKERKHHDATRSTALAVLGAADYHRPQDIIVENVVEFLKWHGYAGWKKMLEDFGYFVTENIMNAADFGVPQSRIRLFITASRKKALVLKSPMRRHVPANSFLDWNGGEWTNIRGAGLVTDTMARIRAGRKKHGKRFLVAYYGNEKGGRSIHRPIGTITTNDRFMLIKENKYRMLSVDETRIAMGFPRGYILPRQKKEARKMLGNAVVPAMMKEFINQVRAA